MRSRATIRPLRTAIRTLSVGCLLLAVVAVLHEQSPSERRAVERTIDGQHGRLATPSDSRSSAPQGLVADDAPQGGVGPVAPPRQNSARFWNASQSASPADRGPAIQLGPLVGRDSTHADGSRAPIAELAADPGQRVTHTYRPASMSAVSLERLVRPLLTARGETVAANAGSPLTIDRSPSANAPGTTSDAESDQPGVLVVSDRPEVISRIDALCHDLESLAPRIAIDVVVVDVSPDAGRQLPLDQWRNSFGAVEADLPSVLTQIRGRGRTTVRASSQLQGISGTWAELEWRAQNVPPGSSRGESDSSADRDASNAAALGSPAAATTITTLRVRPSTQPDGAIRIEVRARSSRLEDHAHADGPQLVTVRFNTEVLLREGATVVINLFVDEPSMTGSGPASPIDPAAAALVIPGGPSIPAAKIVPQPGQREQTLLLLMPRIAGPPRPAGKVAASKAHNPA